MIAPIGLVAGRLLRWAWFLATSPLWLVYFLLLEPRGYDVIEVRLTGTLRDRGTRTGIERFFASHRIGLFELVALVRHALADRRVKGVLVRAEGFDAGGYAAAQEVRGLLDRLRRAGRKVVVHADELGTTSLIAFSGADRLLLSPAGAVVAPGPAVELLFAARLLEGIGVGVDVERTGEYKSAFEPLTERDIPEASREATLSLLDDVHRQLVEAVATGRGRPVEEVRAWIDAGMHTHDEAVARGIVDALVHPAGVEEAIEEFLGSPPRLIEARSYLKRQARRARLRDRLVASAPRVALVQASGVIASHRDSPEFADGVSHAQLAEILETARQDPKVACVVLRVDSPGGSVTESELIRDEIRRTGEAKPVVCCMGNVAGSGGYYVSCGADRIVAPGAALTGSIGVISGKLNAGALAGGAGVRAVLLGPGRRAGMFSPLRPFTSGEASRVREVIGCYYELFKGRVAAARQLDGERVEELARGRVWTGAQALKRRLVDLEGGVWEAIEEALEQAGFAPAGRCAIVVYGERRRLSVSGLLRRYSSAAAPSLLEWLSRPGIWSLMQLRLR